jgi:uncharacterized protein (DUF362 family)
MRKPRVILRNCSTYQVDEISAIIRESVSDLDCQIKGKVFVKPNVVTANKRYIRDSYTHPAVVEAAVQVMKESDPRTIIVGESGGYGTPSRMFFKEAGYYEMAKRAGVDVIDLNEHALEKVPLEKGVWHKDIMLSKHINDADFKLWMPKLKYHVFASITNVLKLNMGILAHKERLLYHDHRIHEKIVDLLEPGYPNLVVSDAIDITYGAEGAPYAVRLGALIIADHPLAADVVAAHIMGYNPAEIQHLKLASERGYGSLNLEDIDISGDGDLENLRSKPKGKSRLFQVLTELDTPIEFYSGCAPDTDIICDGGCECAVKGCLGTIEKYASGSLKNAKKGAIVTGVYKNDVTMPDGPVLIVGDCTKVEGKFKKESAHHIKGCPVSTRQLFGKISKLFKMPNPMHDTRGALLFLISSLVKRCNTLRNRIFQGK